ncbi:MAG: hypothetical protein JSS32_00375 [Verrucomicrobia bacterium]|nr:hypothetical protein [Verrucomicrobiota bacterium]
MIFLNSLFYELHSFDVFIYEQHSLMARRAVRELFLKKWVAARSMNQMFTAQLMDDRIFFETPMANGAFWDFLLDSRG